MFILLYANCVVMYCVSFDVVVGNKLYLILSYLSKSVKVSVPPNIVMVSLQISQTFPLVSHGLCPSLSRSPFHPT